MVVGVTMFFVVRIIEATVVVSAVFEVDGMIITLLHILKKFLFHYVPG